MRTILIILILITGSFANESVAMFEKAPKNRLLCHYGQYSFKLISQKNAAIVKINGHKYFKLKDENLYFLSNACEFISNKKAGIIF